MILVPKFHMEYDPIYTKFLTGIVATLKPHIWYFDTATAIGMKNDIDDTICKW